MPRRPRLKERGRGCRWFFNAVMTIARHIDYLLGPVLAVGLVAFVVSAEPQPSAGADPVAPTSAKWVKVIALHDGDTITEAVIDLGWGRKLHVGPHEEAPGIRAFGYDAWEVTKTRQTVGAITDAEIAKGKAARDDLFELLKSASLYAEDSGQRDPYGRISAIPWARNSDGKWIYLAGWMDQQGHLRTPRK
jgi:endonuclease YncB( thermonuclease family)